MFFDPTRHKVIGGGEGSGKSWLESLYGLCRVVHTAHESGYARKQLIWVVGADYEDARKEADYLLGDEDGDWLARLGVYDPNNSVTSSSKDQKIIHATTIGATFETVSAYDFKKIGREQPDGIIGSEISRWEREVWDRCYGRLQRKRGWGIYGGSFDTSLGWFPELWAMGQGPNEIDLRSFIMPTWCNLKLYPGGEDDPAIIQLRKQAPSEAYFMERFGGRPSPPTDSVLPEFRTLLHVSEALEYDSHYPSFLYIDPGDLVYAVLFVQLVGSEVRVVDELYVTRWTHEQVIQGVQLKAAWRGVKDGVIDVAARQAHMGMGTPLEAWFRDTGMNLRATRRLVPDQIEKLRSVLALNPATGRPYLQIAPRCRGLLTEMGGGNSPVAGIGRWRQQFGVPEKRNDHACKALAYGLLEMYGAVRPAANAADADDAPSYLVTRARAARAEQPSGVIEAWAEAHPHLVAKGT